MPNKTHTTAVVIIPPNSIQVPIQEIRRLHDRNYYRWMPHLTLLYPFTPQQSFQNVIPILCKAAKSIEPFYIRLTSFNAFKHRKSCTLFLVPEPKDKIIQLHSTLINYLPDYNETTQFVGGFNPHLSVGQFQHNKIYDEQQRLQSVWKPIQFKVEAVSLIYRSPETNDRFVVAEKIYFQ